MKNQRSKMGRPLLRGEARGTLYHGDCHDDPRVLRYRKHDERIFFVCEDLIFMKNQKLKAELVTRCMSYIDFAALLREAGVDMTEARLCRIVTGRSNPVAQEKQIMARLLGKLPWEIFVV